MKHLYNLTLGLAAAAAMSLASCADDVAPETPAAPAEGRTVWMSIDVSRGTDPDSRLTHEEAEGCLDADWESGDVIYVFTNKRHTDDAYYDYAYAGPLTYSETVSNTSGATGGHTATFTGSLTIPDGFETGDKVTLWYVGKNADGNARRFTQGEQLSIDYSDQPGTFASMAYNDIMDCEKFDVTVNGNTVTSQATAYMRHVAMFFHFATDLAADTKVVINTEAKNLNGNFIVQTNGLTGMGRKSDGLTVNVSEGGHLYVSMLPFNESALTFTVGSGTADEKTITLPAKALSTGNYYTGDWNATTGKHDGIELTFNNEPENPLDKFGGSDQTFPNSYTCGAWTRVDNGTGGWVNNEYASIDTYGGYATGITYNHAAAIKNGVLSSMSNTDAVFFQWGRWMGFPSNVYYQVRMGYNGVSYYNNEKYPDGITKSTKVGYVNNTINLGAFGYCELGLYKSSWTPQNAKDFAIMFCGVPSSQQSGYFKDYTTNTNTTWQARGGNPCPPGYRIPTMDDLRVLIPSDEGFNRYSSTAEVKTIDGKKVAMRWDYITKNSINFVRIKSFVTESSTVSASDSRFDEGSEILLPLLGYQNNAGQQDNSTTVFWSSESGTEPSYKKGYGAKSMEIQLDGNNVVFAEFVNSRVLGGLIIPIFDGESQPTPLTPWFPIAYNIDALR